MGAGLIRYPAPLVEGVLIGRRKRFFADVRLPNGDLVVAHCANTGSMRGLLGPAAPCRMLAHTDPARRLAWSLEQICVDGAWVMVNTARPNRVVEAALLADRVDALAGYARLWREQPLPDGGRVDLVLSGAPGPPVLTRGRCDDSRRCLVEVKSATLVEDRVARFPDAVTARGTRHVRSLAAAVAAGDRAVLFLHVAREDADAFTPAGDIDPVYADAVRRAVEAGVEVVAWSVAVRPDGLALARPLPVHLA